MPRPTITHGLISAHLLPDIATIIENYIWPFELYDGASLAQSGHYELCTAYHNYKSTSVTQAIISDHPEIMRLILRRRHFSDDMYWIFIHNAMRGSIEVATAFDDRHMQTILDAAGTESRIDVAKKVIADGRINYNYALRRACEAGHHDIVKLLQSHATKCGFCGKLPCEHDESP